MDHKKNYWQTKNQARKYEINIISYFAWSNIFLDINIEYIGTYLIIDNMFHLTHLCKPFEKKKIARNSVM